MSANSSIKKSLSWVGLTLWAVISLIVGQTIAGVILLNITLSTNQNIQTTIGAALGYGIALMIAIGLKPLITQKKPDVKVLGINRLPSWFDIGLGVLSVLPYYLLAGVAVWFGTSVLHVIDPSVGQEIAFTNVYNRIDYAVAFVTFVVFAPLAEELLFRGYLLGNLSEKGSSWLAVVVTALVFGSLHAPGFTESGIVWQWGAAADTFALAIAAGCLRLLTKSIWAGVVLHALKNAIAFYFLFVFPML